MPQSWRLKLSRPVNFKEADLTRVLKSAKKAGVLVRVLIEKDGKIVLVPHIRAVDPLIDDDLDQNPWDKALADEDR
jgi:hypothetical protein